MRMRAGKEIFWLSFKHAYRIIGKILWQAN